MKSQLAMLAAYNSWANRRLYAAVAGLTEAEYRADRGAFFGSLHGTLNHILVGDRIWLSRLTGTGEAPARLDAILFEDFAALRAARVAEDARLEAYIGQVDGARLAGTVRYRTMRSPELIEQQLVPLLLHIFNHQTRHRGQAHCLLTGLTGEAPSLDLLIFQRETGTSIVSGAPGSFPPERRPGA
jgi:uncharacterized damage-inducible protein DinB